MENKPPGKGGAENFVLEGTNRLGAENGSPNRPRDRNHYVKVEKARIAGGLDYRKVEERSWSGGSFHTVLRII